MTGCLPVALDKATRIVQVLLSSGKEYVGIIHLHKNASEEKILEISSNFIGKLMQLPPIRSAVKRQLREREVYYLEILEIKNNDILFKVGSQAGFYVRKLAHDFGKAIGTNAHLAHLVRTKVGYFNDKNWHSLYELKDVYEFYKNGNDSLIKKIVLPFEAAVEHLPKIWVLDTTVDPLCHGAQLANPGISKLNSEIKKNDKVAILTLKNELIAIGTSLSNSEDIISKNKELASSIEKVFMPVNTYPKYKKE